MSAFESKQNDKRDSAGNNLQLFESLLECKSIDELHSSTTKIVKQLGYEHFFYGVRILSGAAPPYQFLLSGYPRAWFKHYVETKYEYVDPVVRHCIHERRVTPIIWNSKVFRNKSAIKLREEAKDFGLASGVSFPVQGRYFERALFSLSTSLPSREANKEILESLGQGQLLALHLHDAVRRVILNEA